VPCSSIPRAIAASLADAAVDAFAQHVGVTGPGVASRAALVAEVIVRIR
jgi:hypothetical protein